MSDLGELICRAGLALLFMVLAVAYAVASLVLLVIKVARYGWQWSGRVMRGRG
jgi:hypothetical protein